MIASDQITLFNGVVREKPESEEEVVDHKRNHQFYVIYIIIWIVLIGKDVSEII